MHSRVEGSTTLTEGSTTVLSRGVNGDERRCSISSMRVLAAASDTACTFVMCVRLARRSMIVFVAALSCVPIVLLMSSRTIDAILSK